MNWMDKLERKIGRYAVPNLMLYIIIMYGAGYVLYLINPAFYAQYLCLNAQAILHGQVWRIITFINIRCLHLEHTRPNVADVNPTQANAC